MSGALLVVPRPFEVSTRAYEWDKPCEVHTVHRPLTIINEGHHPFPQEYQKKVWGKVLDHRLIYVCATSHNSIHYAWDWWEKFGTLPREVVGATRDVVQLGIDRYLAALKEKQ